MTTNDLTIIPELLNKWENKVKYLEAVIKVEEEFYPEKLGVIDMLYARKNELQECVNEIQWIYNKLQITKNQ